MPSSQTWTFHVPVANNLPLDTAQAHAVTYWKEAVGDRAAGEPTPDNTFTIIGLFRTIRVTGPIH